jgi:hypothetical protein
LIHAQVRVAIEAAVHEELAIALGAGRYERHGARRGYRNGVKARTLMRPTRPMAAAGACSCIRSDSLIRFAMAHSSGGRLGGRPGGG